MMAKRESNGKWCRLAGVLLMSALASGASMGAMKQSSGGGSKARGAAASRDSSPGGSGFVRGGGGGDSMDGLRAPGSDSGRDRTALTLAVSLPSRMHVVGAHPSGSGRSAFDGVLLQGLSLTGSSRGRTFQSFATDLPASNDADMHASAFPGSDPGQSQVEGMSAPASGTSGSCMSQHSSEATFGATEFSAPSRFPTEAAEGVVPGTLVEHARVSGARIEGWLDVAPDGLGSAATLAGVTIRFR